MFRRTSAALLLIAIAGLSAACSTPTEPTAPPMAQQVPAQGAVTNPPPAPSTGAPAPVDPAIAGGNVVADWVALVAQGQSADDLVVKDAVNQWPSPDLKDVKLVKFLDSAPEVVRPEEMTLKVNILIQPKGGEVKPQTYYATLVKKQEAWKLLTIGLAKP